MTESLDTYKGWVQIDTDLNHLSEEIIEYLNENNLLIFHGDIILSSESEKVLEVEQRSDEKNWKDFIDVAIGDCQKFLIVDFHKLEKEMIEVEDEDVVEKFSKHIDKIGRISMCWIKDSVVYSYDIATDWMEEYDSMFTLDGKNIDIDDLNDEDDNGSVKYLEDTTEEDIIIEFLKFLELNEDSYNVRPWQLIARDFWNVKGINSLIYSHDLFDSELMEKKKKIEKNAAQRFQKLQLAKERELIPELLNRIVDWSNENGYIKLTNEHVEMFLGEMNLSLSKPGITRLKLNGNERLKRPEKKYF